MNHAFELTKNGVMKITIPEDKEVFFVIVRSPGKKEVFAQSFEVKEMLKQKIVDRIMKDIQEKTNENRNKP